MANIAVILCMKCNHLSILEHSRLFCCEECAGENFKVLKTFNDVQEADVYRTFLKDVHFK
ncbi:hypothetical protein HZB01_02660 [Candidatus Woesearchaeota archaeon]|nr:hypothetical protein [Candidatus Woesearchaeota archaeon]